MLAWAAGRLFGGAAQLGIGARRAWRAGSARARPSRPHAEQPGDVGQSLRRSRCGHPTSSSAPWHICAGISAQRTQFAAQRVPRNSQRCTLRSGAGRQARALASRPRSASVERRRATTNQRGHRSYTPGSRRACDRPRSRARPRSHVSAAERAVRSARNASTHGSTSSVGTPSGAGVAPGSASTTPSGTSAGRRVHRSVVQRSAPGGGACAPGRPISRWRAAALRTRRASRGRRGEDGSGASAPGHARLGGARRAELRREAAASARRAGVRGDRVGRARLPPAP